MISLAIFSHNKTDASALVPGEPVTALALFGNVELDLTGAPREIEATVIALFGSAKLRIREDEEVVLNGFSLFGNRVLDSMTSAQNAADFEPEIGDHDNQPLPMELSAYSIFGSVTVKRGPSFLNRVKQSLKLKPDFGD